MLTVSTCGKDGVHVQRYCGNRNADLSDPEILALIVAPQIEEVALVACADNVAASVCGH